MIKTKTILYHHDDVELEAYYAYDDHWSEKRPAVLICHDWTGKNDFVRNKAEYLTECGYVGFALDMYGTNKIGHTKEEKTALMHPLIENRELLLQRMICALTTVKQLEVVDATRIGAMGFCFGGLCALDLARSGADLKGVVSFHGSLNAPENALKQNIRAKILALHGHNDPMVPPDQVRSFTDEMTVARCDWQLVIYGNTMHAFTNPEANDPEFGTVYNKLADKRSFQAMKDFFEEVL